MVKHRSVDGQQIVNLAKEVGTVLGRDEEGMEPRGRVLNGCRLRPLAGHDRRKVDPERTFVPIPHRRVIVADRVQGRYVIIKP